MVYIGGIYDNNGGQLIKDKVAVLGDNKQVPIMVPDGFTGYPEEDKLPQAQGEYLTFAGLSSEVLSKVQRPGLEAARGVQAEVRPRAVRQLPALRCGRDAGHPGRDRQVRRHACQRRLAGRRWQSSGITIPQSQSVTGKAIVIYPRDR